MANKFLLGFVLTLSVVSTISANIIEDISPVIERQLKIMRLMRNTYAAGDNTRVVDADACFGTYFAQEGQVSQDYSTRYSACMKKSQDDRDELSAQSLEKRAEILGRGDAVCSDLTSCDENTDGLDFFNCYTEAAAKSYPVLYKLSTDSNMQATNLLQFYNQIENDEKKCIAVARNTYIGEMNSCNSNLEACLNGAPLPTSTSAPETTEDSGEPEETTQEPETDEPLPEEDIFRFHPKNSINILKKFKKMNF